MDTAQDTRRALHSSYALGVLGGATNKKALIRKVSVTLDSINATGLVQIDLHRITAQSGGGSLTPVRMDLSDPTPTITAFINATSVTPATAPNSFYQVAASYAATPTPVFSPVPVILHDWKETGEMKPLTIRANTAEGYVVRIIPASGSSGTLGVSVWIDFTEEY